MRDYKTHWISVIDNIYKLIPLLILPLIRGFISALRGGLYAWIDGAWVDIVTVLFILTLSVLNWKSVSWRFCENTLFVRRGIIKRETLSIPIDNICSVSVKAPWYYRPLKAAYLNVDTVAGTKRKSDVKLALSEADALDFLSFFDARLNEKNTLAREYSPRLFYIMILSAILSNSFAGMAIVATAISQSGDILGRTIENQVFGTLTNLVDLLSFGIPPAAAVIAYIILGGWLIAFSANLLRHRRFCLRRHDNTLLVRGGTPTRRVYSLKIKDIDHVTIRQSLATKVLRLYSVFAHCPGFGKKHEDICAITPAVSKKELDRNIAMILPEFYLSPVTIRPNNWAVFRFILDPLYPCAGVPALVFLLIKLFPAWGDFLAFVGVMAMIPAYWFMGVRIVDFLTCGMGGNDESVTLKYSKGFSLCTVIVPREKITSVVFRQSIFQRADDCCDVLVFTRTEGVNFHRLKNMDRKKAHELFKVKD